MRPVGAIDTFKMHLECCQTGNTRATPLLKTVTATDQKTEAQRVKETSSVMHSEDARHEQANGQISYMHI